MKPRPSQSNFSIEWTLLMKVSVCLGRSSLHLLEFRERVLWLQELLVLSRNETEEFDASKLFDDSSDYNPTFV